MFERSSGILLHPTSFPGPHGVGDFGPDAYRFIDFLRRAEQRIWQILPLGPVGPGDSPYDSPSASAGSPLLIALDPLEEMGLLPAGWAATLEPLPVGRADYGAATERKLEALRLAHRRYREGDDAALARRFADFRRRTSDWLEDYTLYAALRDAHDGRRWYEWEPELRARDPGALDEWRGKLADGVEFHAFVQFIFWEQWSALKSYANERGVSVMGDIPIYVSHDSADVWAHQRLFSVRESGELEYVAGVPPDLFSETGQLWGNPCYRWDVIAAEGYRWWIERFRRAFELADIVRVDHFRGFQAGWQVPAPATTAIEGEWVPGPGTDIFAAVARELGSPRIIVEDLGIITEEVHELRERLGYPGMKVLQFAFGGASDNPYLPHNYEHNCVVYTGTHDNDTTRGWFEHASPLERGHALRYLGMDQVDPSWSFIRLAMASVADIAIVPLQDVLGLGREGRMNLPGTAEGNWGWRYEAPDVRPELAERLADLSRLYGRAGVEPPAG